MLNSRKYTALAVLGVGLAVAAATPAQAKAYWFGWAVLRLRRLARGLWFRPRPPVGLRMRLPSRLRSILPAVPVLSTLCVCGVLPAAPILSTLRVRWLLPTVSILSAVLCLRGIEADVSVLSTDLRLWGVLSDAPLLSGCTLLVVGPAHATPQPCPPYVPSST